MTPLCLHHAQSSEYTPRFLANASRPWESGETHSVEQAAKFSHLQSRRGIEWSMRKSFRLIADLEEASASPVTTTAPTFQSC